MRLKGKVAIVTGGTSGIGQATSMLFAREGARVVVAGRNSMAGAKVVGAIRKEGGEAIFVSVNVASPADVREMIDATIHDYGQIDVLFNNAGVLGKEGPVEEVAEEDYHDIMNTNMGGVLWGCKYAIPHMKERRKGSILNMASLGGIKARPNNSIYSASKAGVVLLTKVLARELAPFNIRVNCICPISVNTPMLQAWPPGALEASAKRIPLGRVCEPEDIAHAALFLVSDEASMITAVSLVIDGGFSA